MARTTRRRQRQTKAPARLLQLPAELRNRIYKFILCDESPIAVKRHLSSQPLYDTAILQACREIRNEALPIYYGSNVFVLNVRWRGFQWTKHWLNDIGEVAISCLRKVILKEPNVCARYACPIEISADFTKDNAGITQTGDACIFCYVSPSYLKSLDKIVQSMKTVEGRSEVSLANLAKLCNAFARKHGCD